MKMMKKSLLGLVVLAATTLNAQAADLKVTGKITPSACTPTLSDAGTINYDRIGVSTLNKNTYTVLDPKDFKLTITCTADSKVGFFLRNSRRGSLAGGTEGANDFGSLPSSVRLLDSNIFSSGAGLGLNDREKIGGFAVKLDTNSATADGVEVDNINGFRGVDTWSASNGIIMDQTGERVVTAAAKGSLTPLAFKEYSADLQLQAYLNKASELTLTKEVELDGLVTFVMEYLP